MNKLYPSAAAALEGVVKSGQLLAVGGFGLCGIPEALIAALRDSGARDLTVISNNAPASMASASASCWRPARSER
jgi:3-oxoacid CoA-transferase subunit A